LRLFCQGNFTPSGYALRGPVLAGRPVAGRRVVR
jgi:hypothetical protein